jgi:hypothetical protein
MGGFGLDSSSSGYRLMTGPCKHGNELLGSIKSKEFLDCLNNMAAS